MSANPPILTIPPQTSRPADHIDRYLASLHPHLPAHASEGYRRFLHEEENGFEEVKSYWAGGESSSAGKWSEVVQGNRRVAPTERWNENSVRDMAFRLKDPAHGTAVNNDRAAARRLSGSENAFRAGEALIRGIGDLEVARKADELEAESETSSAERRRQRKLRRQEKASLRRPAPFPTSPSPEVQTARKRRASPIEELATSSILLRAPVPTRRKPGDVGMELARKFEAANVAVKRLTLRPGKSKGFLGRGATSAIRKAEHYRDGKASMRDEDWTISRRQRPPQPGSSNRYERPDPRHGIIAREGSSPYQGFLPGTPLAPLPNERSHYRRRSGRLPPPGLTNSSPWPSEVMRTATSSSAGHKPRSTGPEAAYQVAQASQAPALPTRYRSTQSDPYAVHEQEGGQTSGRLSPVKPAVARYPPSTIAPPVTLIQSPKPSQPFVVAPPVPVSLVRKRGTSERPAPIRRPARGAEECTAFIDGGAPKPTRSIHVTPISFGRVPGASFDKPLQPQSPLLDLSNRAEWRTPISRITPRSAVLPNLEPSTAPCHSPSPPTSKAPPIRPVSVRSPLIRDSYPSTRFSAASLLPVDELMADFDRLLSWEVRRPSRFASPARRSPANRPVRIRLHSASASPHTRDQAPVTSTHRAEKPAIQLAFSSPSAASDWAIPCRLTGPDSACDLPLPFSQSAHQRAFQPLATFGLDSQAVNTPSNGAAMRHASSISGVLDSPFILRANTQDQPFFTSRSTVPTHSTDPFLSPQNPFSRGHVGQYSPSPATEPDVSVQDPFLPQRDATQYTYATSSVGRRALPFDDEAIAQDSQLGSDDAVDSQYGEEGLWRSFWKDRPAIL